MRRDREMGRAATTVLLEVTVNERPLPDGDIVSILRNWTAGDLGWIAAALAPLATMELVIAVQALLESTASVALARDEEPVRETYPLGGWRRVPARLR